VIFLDSNLFVIDLRYPGDIHHRVNRRALRRLEQHGTGVTSVLNVLEVCGILSFNLSPASLNELYVHFARRYRLTLVPGGGDGTRLPAPTAREVLTKMERRMALKDAEIALIVEQHASGIEAFLSWNAKHFAGKLAVPVLTPREWLRGAGIRRSGN
jgi:predicted nucleic acid-binding protein